MGSRKELPAWYHRINKLVGFGEKLEFNVEPHHFDEDISDLECDLEWDDRDCECEGKECEHYCKCEEEECKHDCRCPEAECEHWDGVYDDNASEMSYDGPGVWRYYELKRMRQLQKVERRDTARAEAQMKREAIADNKEKEDEVRAAYEAIKKAKREGETLHLGSLVGKTFRLYSALHAEYWGTCLGLSRYIDFYSLGTNGIERPEELMKNRRLVEGQIYVDPSTLYEFGPFRAPARVRRKKYALQRERAGGEEEITVQFISDKYLILRMSRDLVIRSSNPDNPDPAPESTPDVIEFMGILRDEEADRLEREKRYSRYSDDDFF